MVNVQSGFETTGVYPLDRSKIMPPEYLEESVLEEDVDGLPFLPLLTPSRKSYSRKETDVPRKETDASKNYTYPTAGRPLKEILTYPEPIHKLPTIKPRKTFRVATSSEERQKMELKEVDKAQEKFRKEQNKYIRELKKSLAVSDDIKKLIESKPKSTGTRRKTEKQDKSKTETKDEVCDSDEDSLLVSPLQLSLFDPPNHHSRDQATNPVKITVTVVYMYIDPPDNWSDTLCDTYTFSGGGFESSPLSTSPDVQAHPVKSSGKSSTTTIKSTPFRTHAGVSVQTGRKKTAPDDQAPVVVVDPKSPVKSSEKNATRNVKCMRFEIPTAPDDQAPVVVVDPKSPVKSSGESATCTRNVKSTCSRTRAGVSVQTGRKKTAPDDQAPVVVVDLKSPVKSSRESATCTRNVKSTRSRTHAGVSVQTERKTETAPDDQAPVVVVDPKSPVKSSGESATCTRNFKSTRSRTRAGVSVQTGRKKTAPDDQAPVVVVDPKSPVKSSEKNATRNVKCMRFEIPTAPDDQAPVVVVDPKSPVKSSGESATCTRNVKSTRSRTHAGVSVQTERKTETAPDDQAPVVVVDPKSPVKSSGESATCTRNVKSTRSRTRAGVSVQTGRKKTAPDDQAPVVVIDPESPVKSSGESAARNVKSTPFSTRAGLEGIQGTLSSIQ
ncbi:mucin-2-like isoform X7 [Halichondria panicea]|uniref:mucin-2-like isoform X7 n=1 Tax=Halichondria panicea TaxID=6063 RepID=UPI00312BB68F